MNKKGYVGCGSTGSANRALYEYDPLTDHWAYKTSFPGTGRDHISYFVINSRAYLGLGGEIEGFTPKWKFSDIWEFEPIKNSWKRMHDCVQKINPTTFFSIEDAGFMGFDETSSGIYDNTLWIFEPNKN